MVPIQTPIEVGSAVAWTERRTPWTRWRDAHRAHISNPEVRSSKRAISPSGSKKPHSIAHAIGKFLSEDRLRFGETDHVEKAHIYWQPLKHMVSGVLGHIAYPVLSRLAQSNQIQARTYKSRKDQETRLQNAFVKTIDSRRTLVTSLPWSLGAFERLSGSTSGKHEHIRVRLQPSKMEIDASVELQLLPEVELRIELDEETKKAEIGSVRLIQDERESDLLLPREVADARFRAYTYFDGRKRLDPRIIDFVSASNFNVWGESRLQTPPKLNLFVPQFVLPENARALLKDGDDVEIEYVFASLEYHSYMRTLHEGCRVYYNTVEAGKTGGRRTDLWLETPMMDPQSKDYVKRDFVSFFNTVRNLLLTMEEGAASSLF